jgi:hypothetical protein
LGIKKGEQMNPREQFEKETKKFVIGYSEGESYYNPDYVLWLESKMDLLGEVVRTTANGQQTLINKLTNLQSLVEAQEECIKLTDDEKCGMLDESIDLERFEELRTIIKTLKGE